MKIIDNINKTLSSNYKISLISFSLVIFLLLLPFSLNINYIQNDEWVHYKVVENFQIRHFNLHPYLGSTFYLQGLLGIFWAILFGINLLPVLTLVFSIVNFIISFLIVFKITKHNFILSFLINLIIYFNPIIFYSHFGFMIEEYLLTFLLLFVYFGLNNKFNWANIFLICGFFVKQNFIFFNLGYLIYLMVDSIKSPKIRKNALVEAVIILSTILFYYLGFPKTVVMQHQTISFFEIFDYKKLLLILIYLVALLIPLHITFIISLKKRFHLLSSFIILLALVYIFYFYDLSLKFPYFQNIFTREGFLKADLDGLKYHLKGFYKLYESWQFISIAILSILIQIIISTNIFIIRKFKMELLIKNKERYFLISIFLGYLSFVIFNAQTYDRYLLPLIVLLAYLCATFLSSKFNALQYVIYSIFVFFIISISVIYHIDFTNTQKYIWSKSFSLLLDDRVLTPKEIHSTHAWNNYHNEVQNKVVYKYEFTYDSPDTLDNPKYKLIDTYTNKSVTLFFVDPKIYLYQVLQ